MAVTRLWIEYFILKDDKYPFTIWFNEMDFQKWESKNHVFSIGCPSLSSYKGNLKRIIKNPYLKVARKKKGFIEFIGDKDMLNVFYRYLKIGGVK